MDSTNTIYIENFPLDTEENHLSKVFSSFGKIKHIHVPSFNPGDQLNRGRSIPLNKGHAFIEYYCSQDSTKACEFFADLKNILDQSDQSELSPSATSEDHRVVSPELKRLPCMRVMMKQTFLSLSRTYDEKRFQSLIKVAKQLVV